MTTRARRLAEPVGIAATGTVIFTCPTDRTAICRSLWLANQGVAPSTILLALIIDGSGHDLWRGTIPAADSLVLDKWFAMNPDDVLLGVSTPGTCTANLFGSLLLGVPT